MRILFLILIILGLEGCDTKQESAPKNVIRPVKVIAVHTSHQTPPKKIPGTLKAHRKTMLSFQIAGKIARLNAVEGQPVTSGSLIAQLDLQDATYVMEGLKARLKKATQDLKRYEKLFEDKVVPLADYQKIKADYDVLVSDLKRAGKVLDDSSLHAPYDGLVTKRYVELHQEVDKHKDIALVQDISTLDIQIAVPARWIAQSSTDARPILKATFDSLPGQEFPLSIREYEAEADAKSLTYLVTLSMQNPDPSRLLPGMPVNVLGYSEVPTQGIRIAPEAIFSRPDQSKAVFVYKNGQVHETSVKTSDVISSSVGISSGLKPGDLVVIAGVSQLTDGQSVRLYKEELK